MNKQYTYRIIFLRKQDNILFFYKTKKLFSIDKTNGVKFESKSFFINISNCSYINRKKEFVFFIDYDDNSTYSFKEITSIVNPKSLDLMLKTKLVESLTSGISDEKFPFFIAIMMFFMGLFVMLVIFQFIPRNVPVVDPNIIPDFEFPTAFIKNLKLFR